MSVCRSCKRPIRWVVTEGGRAMPVDAEPVAEGGNVRLEDHAGETLAVYVQPGDGTHVSHFATCPNADAHRRNRVR